MSQLTLNQQLVMDLLTKQKDEFFNGKVGIAVMGLTKVEVALGKDYDQASSPATPPLKNVQGFVKLEANMQQVITDDMDGYVVGKDGRFYEICLDQRRDRLWINADDGSAIARFNTRSGVDVHNTVSEQMNGAPECLWCTHGKPDLSTWQDFIKAVEDNFGIKVPDDAIDTSKLSGQYGS